MIKVSDSCSDAMALYDLSEWDVRVTHTNADDRTILAIGGVPITIAEKNHGARRLITCAFHAPGKEHIGLVIPVPETIETGPTPLDTFVALCEKYGHPVFAGDTVSKLIIQTQVDGPIDRIGVNVPEGERQFQMQLLAKPNSDGTVDVAFACCIDMTKVFDDL